MHCGKTSRRLRANPIPDYTEAPTNSKKKNKDRGLANSLREMRGVSNYLTVVSYFYLFSYSNHIPYHTIVP